MVTSNRTRATRARRFSIRPRLRRGSFHGDWRAGSGRRASRVHCVGLRPRLDPRLQRSATHTNPRSPLFLSASGEPLCADWLSRTTKAYIAAGAPGKRGSCHLFRHTCATLMLEGGADIRYVSEMLGHAKQALPVSVGTG
ncbi:MAG: tyrosine-type recombinase/integrase [Acidimicrobiales bacterium]